MSTVKSITQINWTELNIAITLFNLKCMHYSGFWNYMQSPDQNHLKDAELGFTHTHTHHLYVFLKK